MTASKEDRGREKGRGREGGREEMEEGGDSKKRGQREGEREREGEEVRARKGKVSVCGEREREGAGDGEKTGIGRVRENYTMPWKKSTHSPHNSVLIPYSHHMLYLPHALGHKRREILHIHASIRPLSQL